MGKTTNGYKGLLLLAAAAFIWGTSFAAQSAASDTISPFAFNALRGFIAVIFLLIVIFVRGAISKRKVNAGTEAEVGEYISGKGKVKSLWIGGIICGIVLFAATNLQQGGITIYPSDAAASGRAGFITSTYVVMVAVVAWIITKKMHWATLAASIICVAGMYFLCVSDGISNIYLGDIVVFIGAVAFTVYIMVVDRCSQIDGIKLSCIQFLTSGILSLIAMFIFEPQSGSQLASSIASELIPILYCGVLSSGVAYTFQIVGQKYTNPAPASIIMSLESIFAVLGGWVVLGEHLSGMEIFGCVLVFAAVILAQVPEFKKPSPEEISETDD